jgi:hypothetical protein
MAAVGSAKPAVAGVAAEVEEAAEVVADAVVAVVAEEAVEGVAPVEAEEAGAIPTRVSATGAGTPSRPTLAQSL